jgi:uncharacterized protein YlxW (UPF0749 family)
MIINSAVVAIVFRILNFVVLIGLIVYLYKQYLHKLIIAMIEQKKRTVLGLEQERAALIRRLDESDQRIKSEQEEYNRLQKKVADWQASVEHERLVRVNKKQAYIDSLKKQAALRVQNVTTSRIMLQALPIVLDRTQVQLEKTFDSIEAKKKFMNRIIVTMQESKS